MRALVYASLQALARFRATFAVPRNLTVNRGQWSKWWNRRLRQVAESVLERETELSDDELAWMLADPHVRRRPTREAFLGMGDATSNLTSSLSDHESATAAPGSGTLAWARPVGFNCWLDGEVGGPFQLSAERSSVAGPGGGVGCGRAVRKRHGRREHGVPPALRVLGNEHVERRTGH